MSWSAGASPSRARRRWPVYELRGQLVLGEEGGGGVQTSLGGPRIGRRANFCCSLLYISLYRKLLYKAESRCIRRYTRTRIASRPSRAIQHIVAIQRYTLYSYTALYTILVYNLYTTPLCPFSPRDRTRRAGAELMRRFGTIPCRLDSQFGSNSLLSPLTSAHRASHTTRTAARMAGMPLPTPG